MNKIVKFLPYGAIAVATLSVMVFVVLPQLPQVKSEVNTVSSQAVTVLAWADGSGGSGGCCGGESPGGGGFDYGGGGGGGGSYTPPPPPPPPPPVAKCNSLSASTTSVPHGGDNVTLSWSTTNAGSVSISGIGGVGASGSTSVFVNSNRTFTLTATAAGGSDTCTVSVTVQPPPPVAKCDSLTASRTTVPHNGGNVALTWKTTNATSAHLSGVGNVNTNGDVTVFVDSNKTFTLTATGTSGSDTCTVSITLEPEEEEDLAKCISFTSNKDEVDEDGETVKLTWQTENATSVEITGVGNVSKNGSVSVFVDDDETFTLIAKGTNNSDSCKVEIDTEEEDDEPRPRCELDISRDHVKKGDRVTLSWETDDADDIRIRDNHGNTIVDTSRSSLMDGEVDVIINRDTEFTLNARGDGGSRSCEVEVEIEDDFAVYEKRDQGYVIALTQVPYTGFEAGTFLTFLFYAMLTLWALFIAYILVIKRGSVLGFSLYGQNAGFSEADVANRKKVEALVAKYSAQNNWK